MNILAKSDGATLIQHSKDVADLAVELFNVYYDKPDVREIIKFAALLHDIGKATEQFQASLNNEDSDKNIQYLHNEVGWAFCYKYSNIPENILNQVCESIYWHHGIINKMGSYTAADVLDQLSETDLFMLKSAYLDIMGEPANGDRNEYDKDAPTYYKRSDEENAELIIVRSCIIAADQLTSAGKGIEDFISSLKSNEFKIQGNPYNSKRTELQQNIAKNCNKTAMIKAPAGFGKTLLGLMWAAINGKKILWVCPRNAVAHSVYESILDELNTFNTLASVELYLSGQVQKINGPMPQKGFTSDIVVTNIDNFLNCTVDNGGNMLLAAGGVDVVFDEFHELVGESALFSLFVSIMKVRNRHSKARTLLLSATPMIDPSTLWDSLINKTQILPNKAEHYPAVHNKPYELVDKNVSFKDDTNTLYIYNAISNAQLFAGKNRYAIIHGNYEKSKRPIIFKRILDMHGKASPRIKNKPNLVGTHIVQAALDLSFCNLSDSVLSPESTLQRIGRVNRWGDYDQSQIKIENIDNRAENMVKNSMYDKNLLSKWVDTLSKIKKFNLDELYKLYNNFNEVNGQDIHKYLRKVLTESTKNLLNAHPIKYFGNKKESEVITAGSNKLRGSGNEIFYIVKKEDGTYSDTFTKKIYFDFSQEFDLSESNMKIIKRAMRDMKDDRYDYTKMTDNRKKLDNLNAFSLKNAARKSNTPIIRVGYTYDDTYGVINNEVLLEINKD